MLSVYQWILKWSKILWNDVDPFRTQFCFVFSAVNLLLEVPSKELSKRRMREIIVELEKVQNRKSEFYYWPRGNFFRRNKDFFIFTFQLFCWNLKPSTNFNGQVTAMVN